MLLGQALGFPILHADRLFWQPGWIDPDTDAYREEIDGLTSSGEWIFDGNPGRVFDIVLPRADTVIWLEQPPWKSLIRAYGRMFRYLGRVRPDMAEGCREKLNLRLWRYAAQYRIVQRPRIEKWLVDYANSARLLRLEGDTGVADFLSELPKRTR